MSGAGNSIDIPICIASFGCCDSTAGDLLESIAGAGA